MLSVLVHHLTLLSRLLSAREVWISYFLHHPGYQRVSICSHNVGDQWRSEGTTAKKIKQILSALSPHIQTFTYKFKENKNNNTIVFRAYTICNSVKSLTGVDEILRPKHSKKHVLEAGRLKTGTCSKRNIFFRFTKAIYGTCNGGGGGRERDPQRDCLCTFIFSITCFISLPWFIILYHLLLILSVISFSIRTRYFFCYNILYQYSTLWFSLKQERGMAGRLNSPTALYRMFAICSLARGLSFHIS